MVAQMLKRLQKTQVQSLGREYPPGEGNGNPHQYSCLENPMEGGAWYATVHGFAKSQTQLSDFTLLLLTFEPLELENWINQKSIFQCIVPQGLAGSSSVSYILLI